MTHRTIVEHVLQIFYRKLLEVICFPYAGIATCIDLVVISRKVLKSYFNLSYFVTHATKNRKLTKTIGRGVDYVVHYRTIQVLVDGTMTRWCVSVPNEYLHPTPFSCKQRITPIRRWRDGDGATKQRWW